MNKEFKKKWVAALRSGKYEQGRLKLHDTYKDVYCCLGVACDLLVKDKVLKGVKIDTDREAFCLPEVASDDWSNMYASSIPTEAAKKIELMPDIEGLLMEMNDSDRKSFKEIADYIEKNL